MEFATYQKNSNQINIHILKLEIKLNERQLCGIKEMNDSNSEVDFLANFFIGQTTGHRLDEEVVSRDMRRARCTDGARVYESSEFLTTSQEGSFSSRKSAAVLFLLIGHLHDNTI